MPAAPPPEKIGLVNQGTCRFRNTVAAWYALDRADWIRAGAGLPEAADYVVTD